MNRRLAILALSAVAASLARFLPARPAQDGALPPARHESSDIGFRPMFIAGLAMLAAMAAILGLSAWLYPQAMQDKSIPQPLPNFPAPQLQPSPPSDMAAFRAQQLRQLTTAYWLDRDAKRVHLPIAQAMQDVARRGIPDWPAQ